MVEIFIHVELVVIVINCAASDVSATMDKVALNIALVGVIVVAVLHFVVGVFFVNEGAAVIVLTDVVIVISSN